MIIVLRRLPPFNNTIHELQSCWKIPSSEFVLVVSLLDWLVGLIAFFIYFFHYYYYYYYYYYYIY